MRILHLDSGLSMRGGQWQALRLMEGLAESGHGVALLASQGSPLIELARSRGLETRALTALEVRRLSREADLVHAHDARSHTLAAVAAGAPLVVSRRVSFPVKGALSRWKYSRPRRFIAVSHYVKSVLESAGVGGDKIDVVYDGVPSLAGGIAVERVVIPASDDPAKGTALAIEAAKLAGIEAHVSKDLERDLPGASLFVYITYSEGLGSGALLAMSAGVPVVASRVGGIPEIVADGESGLLTGNTAQEIAAAIMRLRDREFAARLGMRGRQMVEERFTVAEMVSGTIRAYERALACSQAC